MLVVKVPSDGLGICRKYSEKNYIQQYVLVSIKRHIDFLKRTFWEN